MISAGFSSCQSSEDADIIIINTCGFIEPAKKESIEVIFDALSMKEGDPDHDNKKVFTGADGAAPSDFTRKVVVTGCFSKRYFSDIEKDIPEIDFLYGIPDEFFVGKMAHAFLVKINTPVRTRRSLYRDYPYSYIKISDGCSNNCSFCAIPLIRGPLVSFSPDFVIEESRNAVAGGALELIVIAQDIAVYKHGQTDLNDIVNRMSELDGVKWIRLLYCHPDHMTDRIIDLIAENDKVVPYIDIPFQHINRDILESMGRKGDYDTYMSLLGAMRKRIPMLNIRSTFMVGYPGETEEHFNELLDFVRDARLDKVGCFAYSPEEDTESFALGDPVSDDEKEKRLSRLMEVQREISMDKLSLMIGMELDVLVEEKYDENTYIGRTEFDAPEVDGVFYLTSSVDRVNHIVRAKVTDSIEYDLIGEII